MVLLLYEMKTFFDLNMDLGWMQYESNARFVKWSDGSMQLLLGSEVLDLAVQDAHHDQSHLFLRQPKVIS